MIRKPNLVDNEQNNAIIGEIKREGDIGRQSHGEKDEIDNDSEQSDAHASPQVALALFGARLNDALDYEAIGDEHDGEWD